MNPYNIYFNNRYIEVGGTDMKYQLSNNGPFSLVKINLSKDEEIKIERGSMVYHNGNISLEGKLHSKSKNISVLGNMLKSVAKSVVSGESIFVSVVRGLNDDGEINIAPATFGTIRELNIGSQKWLLNDGVFLACDNSVEYQMKRQTVGKAMFGGTGGLFVMETTGEGMMLINGYGDIQEIDLDGTRRCIIDNKHVLAWENSLDYDLKVASGDFGFSTGEGIVNEFTGIGKILIQTRNISGLSSILSSSSNHGLTFL